MPGLTRTEDPVKIEIDEELLSRLESLPDTRTGAQEKAWKAQEDEILRRFWGKKRQVDIANVLGRHVGCCRERWRKLQEEANGRD